MGTAMVLLNCCSDTTNICHNIQVKKVRKGGKAGGITKRTPLEDTKRMAATYYDTSHRFQLMMQDKASKARVEDWDKMLFAKRNDNVEKRNLRDSLIPEEKRCDDEDDLDGNDDDIWKTIWEKSIADLEDHHRNACGQGHQGYQSTLNWDMSGEGDLKLVDGQGGLFDGLGCDLFNGPSPKGVAQV